MPSNGMPSQASRSTSSDSHKRVSKKNEENLLLFFTIFSSFQVRKLWWSPKRNEVEIRSEYDTNYKGVSSKVDSFANIEYRPGGGQVSIRDQPVSWQASSKVDSFGNANWAPPPPRVNVKTEKLQWNAQPKVDSMSNIDFKPPGGTNIAIRDEKLDFSHVTPRIDCGFVD